MARKRTLCWRRGQGRLPRWDARKGWTGGSKNTLFVFTDKRTGYGEVAPPYSAGTGPDAHVRVATRDEAEGRVEGIEGWQSPLHAGWKVLCD